MTGGETSYSMWSLDVSRTRATSTLHFRDVCLTVR